MVYLPKACGMCVKTENGKECSSIISMPQEMTNKCSFYLSLSYDYDKKYNNQTVRLTVNEHKVYIQPEGILTPSSQLGEENDRRHEVVNDVLNVR